MTKRKTSSKPAAQQQEKPRPEYPKNKPSKKAGKKSGKLRTNAETGGQ